jgi:hypothetical protein
VSATDSVVCQYVGYLNRLINLCLLILRKVPPNAVLDWGYLPASENEEDGEWLVVDKTKGDDAPSGIEKKIGFEGIPDKNTGFYCYYHEGRIVAREEIGKGKKKSDV